MATRIVWTDDEWQKLAVAFLELRAEYPRTHKKKLFEMAQRRTIEVARWRNVHQWADVAPRMDPLVSGVRTPRRTYRKRDPNEVMIDTKLAQASESRVRVERGTIQIAAEALIAEVVKEVAGAIGLKVMSEVQRQVEVALMGLDQRILAALPSVAPAPAADPPQQINITTAEVPEGVGKVTVAPKDRKARVCVAGLMNQQINDVIKEFGNLIDLTFVKTEKSNQSSIDAYRGKDLVVCMTRFSSHSVEREAAVVNVPVVRITGAVSMLKRWLRKWLNHEIAITEQAA